MVCNIPHVHCHILYAIIFIKSSVELKVSTVRQIPILRGVASPLVFLIISFSSEKVNPLKGGDIMFFTLILENKNGDQINMTTTANQYMTSKVEGLSPPPGMISTSGYAGMGTAHISTTPSSKSEMWSFHLKCVASISNHADISFIKWSSPHGISRSTTKRQALMCLRRVTLKRAKCRISSSSQPDKSPFSVRIFTGTLQILKWRITAKLWADLPFRSRQKQILSRLPSDDTTRITSWKSPMTAMKRDSRLK